MMKKDYMQETVNYILYYGTKSIKHEYRVRNGAHTDSYWRESMKEALPFIERSFKGESYPQETLKNSQKNYMLLIKT